MARMENLLHTQLGFTDAKYVTVLMYCDC